MNYNPNLSQHFAHNFVEPNVTRPRRSIGRRISRAFVRYSILLLMGVGATLAWQSYRDEAMEVIRTELPSVASIWPVSTARPPLDGQASAAAVVREVVQQLKPMAVDLAIMRRSAEQLATISRGDFAMAEILEGSRVVTQITTVKLTPDKQHRHR